MVAADDPLTRHDEGLRSPAGHWSRPSEPSSDGRARVRLARKGRLLVGEPYFEGGVPVVLDRKGAGEASVGDLVVVGSVVAGPDRARARAGKPDRRRRRGSLWHEGVRPNAPLPPLPREEPDRVDLRHLYAFTIDPEGAKDFDDALTFRAEERGGVRAWVHIADVSAYVPAGLAPRPRRGRARNSVYVPGRVAPMLPHELSDDPAACARTRIAAV